MPADPFMQTVLVDLIVLGTLLILIVVAGMAQFSRRPKPHERAEDEPDA